MDDDYRVVQWGRSVLYYARLADGDDDILNGYFFKAFNPSMDNEETRLQIIKYLVEECGLDDVDGSSIGGRVSNLKKK